MSLMPAVAPPGDLDSHARAFYQRAMRIMQKGGLPFLVGGSYAFACFTGIERHSKDFDVFISREDWPRAEALFRAAGYEAKLTFSHWIGKVFQGDDFVDLIFGAGNGVASVDSLWFRHAVPSRVLGMEVELIPAEEMIWSKGLIMERERFDGADVAHVIHALAPELDWRRLIDRYGLHWRALYAHMILFGFIYPSARNRIPAWAMDELSQRLAGEASDQPGDDKACFGTILSRQQYLVDVNQWGYKDARLLPPGSMSEEEIAQWTAGIAIDGHTP
jgi:hypothetical protein